MQGLDVVDEVGSSIAAQRRRQARVDAEGYPARVAGVGVGEGHGNDGVVRVDGAQAQWGGPIGKILPVASDEMSGQIAAARGARGWGWGGRRSWPLCWRGGWCGRWRPTWAEERHIIDIHAALPIPSMHKDGEAGRGAAGDGDAKLRIAAAAGPGAAAFRSGGTRNLALFCLAGLPGECGHEVRPYRLHGRTLRADRPGRRAPGS